jgi:ABC-type lipoprotein export system ATPase subunit
LIITHDRDLAASIPRRIYMRDGVVESDEIDGMPLVQGATR